MGLKNSKDEEGETAQLKQTQQLSTGETISLHEAVINLDAKAVYHCLKNGASVNAGDEVGGYTPLHLAATNNSREIALKLLNQGADINAVTKGGRTVLQVALVSNASAVVSLLLRRGVDVNALDMMGRSALHFAAAYKNEEVAKLIRHGSASVNKVGKWGFTPLHLAAFDNNKDAAKELLRQGACINAVKNDRRSALHVAARHGSTETALELMRCGADVNLIDKNGCTALHLAARSSNSEIVTGLLKRGAAVDAVNSSGRTALHVASQIDRTQVVAELLRQGANINAKDAIGITPSHVAATFHCRDTASMLVYSGANIALMDNTGETALHLAVIKNNRVTANAMLQADPNLVKLENRDGQTALHVAASAGSEENVELLLKKNVKVNAVDSRGNTALHYALANSRYNVTRILLEQSEILLYPKNKDGNSFLHLWASLSPQNKDYDFITNCGKSLIQGGAKVNARNDRDQTALHLAARWEAVTLLIDNGAWPNVKEMNNGETPLLTRVKSLQKSSYFIYNQQDKEEVQIQHWQKLLQKGFDPWMVDDSNETVLSILLKNENLCLANALVNVVAKNSKDVNKKHANGLTILHVLCSLGNDELQELIDSVLKLRASVNEVGPARETPLHLVCRRIIEIDDHQDSLAQTMFYWTASRLLAYGADPYLQDNSGESCLDIVQKIPQMLCLLKKPIDPGIIPPLLKWSDPRSENHRSKVAQVVRGHNSKKIHCYHYHKEPIGSGAFGHVYPGIDERNGREVAVKRSEKQRLLRPEARREISNLVKLRDCDEVVRYISHYEDDHFVYLILDLMEGMLEDYLDKFPRDLAEDLVLCKDIVKGLKFLHQNNILHRDIKPGNILYKVSPRLCLKLADFGLSGRATSAADGTTETRSVMHDAAGTTFFLFFPFFPFFLFSNFPSFFLLFPCFRTSFYSLWFSP